MPNDRNNIFNWSEGYGGDQPVVEMGDSTDSDFDPTDDGVNECAGVTGVGGPASVDTLDTGKANGAPEPTKSSASANVAMCPPKTDPNKTQESPTKRIYPSDIDGRFIVYIREWKISLPHITIPRYLCKKYATGILQIVKVHKQKIRVECSNSFTANLLVADGELNKEFRVSVPADVVEINGVISISNDLNTLDLVNFGAGVFGDPSIPSVQIVDAYRMRKTFTHNGKDVPVDSEQVRVTFKGRALPKIVIIFGSRVPVRLYKPKLMFCDRCQGFNHTSKFCTSPLKCGKCGEQHDTASCQLGPKCALCLENVIHKKREECPVFQERTVNLQNRVKFRSKIAYSKLINSVSNSEILTQKNQFSLLSDDSGEDEEIPEGASYSSVVTGKRRRPTSQKSNPSKKRVSIPENVRPSTSNTSSKINSTPVHRKKVLKTLEITLYLMKYSNP
jgi:hypothetical protein